MRPSRMVLALVLTALCFTATGRADTLPILPGYSVCNYCVQQVTGGTVGSTYLSTTCGDGVCNGLAGTCDLETPINCPLDCRKGDVMAYYYLDTHCDQVDEIRAPTSTLEARAAIRDAIAAGQRVNFAGSGHTGNQLLCTDGMSLRTAGMNDIFGIESFEGETVVHLEGGVKFWDLLNWLDARGYALHYAFTGYGGISVGGALATGVHGTLASGGTSSLSHLVRSIEIVQADGEIHDYSRATTGVTDPELWRALRANLGALGLVTSLRLVVRPRFNVHMRLDVLPESALLEPGGIETLSEGCDYFVTLWYPGRYTRKLLRFCGAETTEPMTNPKAANILIAPDIAPSLQYDFTRSEQLGACDDNIDHLEELKRFDFLSRASTPLTPDPTASPVKHVTEIVGSWHRMMEWMLGAKQLQYTQTDWEVAVPVSQFDALVNAVNEHVKAHDMAFSVVGGFIRMDEAADDSLLGGNAVGPDFPEGEPLVHFELPHFVPWNMAPNQRAHFEKRWHDLMTLLVDRFSVRPHWGKNQSWLFSHPSVLAENAERRARFQDVIDRLDPTGVFARAHLAQAGFDWPESLAVYDRDGDGESDGRELTVGTDPARFNGFRVRVARADPAGDCAYTDSYAEVESAFSGSKVLKDWNATRGWEFDTSAHDFTHASYGWSPWPVGSGIFSWSARFSAKFHTTSAGTYCFSLDNGATGSGIVAGKNACLNAFWDGARIAETGYSTAAESGASPRTGCVTVTARGEHAFDVVSRNHDANLFRPFRLRLRTCRTPSGTCTPSEPVRAALLSAE